MREESFDRLIQNKLNQLGEEWLPQDWEKMAQRLEEESLDTDSSDAVVGMPFDEIIQEKIAEYQDEGSPDLDWQALSSQMYGAFDSSLENTFSSYEVPYDPASWEEMVEYMERPFYHMLRNKLGRFSVPFFAQDWKQMRKRLDREAPVHPSQPQALPWQVYAVAASLAFLLVFLPFLKQPASELGPDNLAEQTGTEMPSEEASRGKSAENTESQEEISNTPAQNTGESTPLPIPLESGQTLAFEPEELPLEAPTIAPIGIQTEPLGSTALTVGNRIKGKALEMIPIPVEGTIEEEGFLALEEGDQNASLIVPVEYVLDQKLSEEKELLPLEAVKIEPKRNRFDPEFLVGLHGGTTSSMAELNDKGEPGFLVGARVEVRFTDQVSFVSGIQYAEKSFSHQFALSEPLNNASGSRRVSQVNEASFSTMELPVLLRLRLPSDEKNAMYIQSGIVSFFMINESYRRYDPASAQNTDIVDPLLDPKELDFTNRNLNFTTYIANLHAAIGYEHRFSDRLLFQIEPYFQMSLQEMGFSNSSDNNAEKNNLYTGGIEASIIYDLGAKNKKTKQGSTKIF